MTDQHRHNRDVARQGCLDLDTDQIVGIVQTTLTVLSFGLYPVFADDGQENVALTDGFFDILAKVEADGDAIDIVEERFFAELRLQAIVEPTGGIGVSCRR